MGNGFAFVAKQKHFQVGDSDFYADLILSSIKLHSYIVVELKATPFKPEYAGQLNFYINIVDDQLRGENDNKTIGLLLCKGKDEAKTTLNGLCTAHRSKRLPAKQSHSRKSEIRLAKYRGSGGRIIAATR